MNLLVIDIGIGIGHEKDLIIGYRYRFKFFISCIPIKYTSNLSELKTMFT